MPLGGGEEPARNPTRLENCEVAREGGDGLPTQKLGLCGAIKQGCRRPLRIHGDSCWALKKWREDSPVPLPLMVIWGGLEINEVVREVYKFLREIWRGEEGGTFWGIYVEYLFKGGVEKDSFEEGVEDFFKTRGYGNGGVGFLGGMWRPGSQCGERGR
ncbi:hypothetical protein BC829DRAFT_414409 [Chytridium lagenaria]|nr:hypothetical protein BC829DRAFT_414409 [Chytridium lagenaria]